MTLFFSLNSFAQEYSDSFLITILPDKVKVISPEKKKSEVTVVIENKSLSTINAKIATISKNVKFVTIPSREKETVSIKIDQAQGLKFVPISPAFQEIELIFGRTSYEIP